MKSYQSIENVHEIENIYKISKVQTDITWEESRRILQKLLLCQEKQRI